MKANIQSSYDKVAAEYALRIYGELQHKPFDRALLDQFAEKTRDKGIICDMGCGPGQVARYLHERGLSVCGVDLSREMVAQARRLNPSIEFQQGDMAALNVPDGTWVGIVAFYSLIHIPRDQIVQVLQELKRTLRPDGMLLIAFHIGDDVIHLDEWWGHGVSADFVLFHPQEMAGYLREAGFHVEDISERAPYPDVEHPSRRAYLFASKPHWTQTKHD